MNILSFCILFPLSIYNGECDVQFTKKAKHGGVSFLQVKNSTIASMESFNITDTGTEISVDIVMMADYSMFRGCYYLSVKFSCSGFLEVTKGDENSAQLYIQEYLTAIFDQMKIIYENVVIANQKLHLNMTGTFIAIREMDCPILTDVTVDYDESNSTLNYTTYESFEEFNSTDLTLKIPAVAAVAKLTTWIKHFNNYLPKHDHAILLTKFDLLSPRGDSATQGMAYVGEICRAGESSSVVEDVGAAATALVAAHELGHSLGAFHDGSHNKSFECPSSKNYLMATTVSGSEKEELFHNSRRMSECSTSSILETINKPTSFCLKKPKFDRQQRSATTEQMKPGERFPLQQQCQISFGPHYGICSNNDYYGRLSLCRRIWCKNRMEKRSAPCETRTYLPALDGTECGKYKWCINGECVLNKKKMMECQDLNAKTCAKYTKSKLRHFCNSKQFQEICCSSCANLKDPTINLFDVASDLALLKKRNYQGKTTSYCRCCLSTGTLSSATTTPKDFQQRLQQKERRSATRNAWEHVTYSQYKKSKTATL